ncbi:hypothetical protein [Bacillus coreaensis]
MDGKPMHYDGSLHGAPAEGEVKEQEQEPFKLTDVMRANISGNPFTTEN